MYKQDACFYIPMHKQILEPHPHSSTSPQINFKSIVAWGGFLEVVTIKYTQVSERGKQLVERPGSRVNKTLLAPVVEPISRVKIQF